MKRHAILLASGALLAMSAGAAYADCAEELAQLEAESGTAAVGVEAEPGTQAGEAPATAEAGEAAGNEATAEMEAEAGTQAGEAVETAEGAEAEQEVDQAALERARAALAAGDEQGCMEALEEARG